jgi:hypothetical protein
MGGFFDGISNSVAHAFPAISAQGLAAHHAASHARLDQGMRSQVMKLAQSRHPSARLCIAGLKSVAA